MDERVGASFQLRPALGFSFLGDMVGARRLSQAGGVTRLQLARRVESFVDIRGRGATMRLMGFTVRLPELEAFLDGHARAWRIEPDSEWRRVAARWEAVFRGPVERRERHLAGVRAREEFASRLPADVLMLSGLEIPEVGNVACRGAALYRVLHLVDLDLELPGRCEVAVIGAEFDWCLLTSHETALGAAHELFFARGDHGVD